MGTGQTSSRSRASLADYYRELLEEQAGSDLSMTEFADEVGVSAATLYGWRRRLADSAEGTEAQDLLEVQLTDEEAAQQRRSPIVLTVDGRLRIELEADFDAGALERLLRLLSQC